MGACRFLLRHQRGVCRFREVRQRGACRFLPHRLGKGCLSPVRGKGCLLEGQALILPSTPRAPGWRSRLPERTRPSIQTQQAQHLLAAASRRKWWRRSVASVEVLLVGQLQPQCFRLALAAVFLASRPSNLQGLDLPAFRLRQAARSQTHHSSRQCPRRRPRKGLGRPRHCRRRGSIRSCGKNTIGR